MSDHNTSAEYKGGQPSPPPGKPDLSVVRTILNTAKAVGYQGITQINLEPKHKKEGFDPIPLCIPIVTSLLESLGLNVFKGDSNSSEDSDNNSDSDSSSDSSSSPSDSSSSSSGGSTDSSSNNGSSSSSRSSDSSSSSSNSGNSNSSNNSSSSTTSNASNSLSDAINNISNTINQVSDTIGQIGSGISSLMDSESSSSSVNGTSSSNTGTSSSVANLAKMSFLNFSGIDTKAKATTNKNSVLTDNPEAIVTQASIDRAASESSNKIKEFESRFRSLVADLITNIEKYPSQLSGQSSVMSNSVSDAITKIQLAINVAKNNYGSDYNIIKEDASDLPEEWRP